MARRSRSRELAGLAALGALGYSIFGAEGRRRKDGSVAPVEERDVRGAAPVPVVSSASTRRYDPDAFERDFVAGPQETFMGLDNVSGPQAETGGLGRSTGIIAADQGAMPPPASAAQAQAAQASQARRPAAAPARATAPQYDPRLAGLSAASIGASEAAAINRAREERQAPARQAAQRARYGVPISPPPDAPSIYASPAVRQAYRQGQAIERSVAPATQQGSARNIVQQMRQKDAGLPERMRQRQQEQAAAAEQRRIEAEMNLDPSERLMRGYKKGGAVKAKPKTQAKKMSSGGMSSASKRADGIATKGKTKCKMY